MSREWKSGEVVWMPGVGRAIATGDGDRFMVGRPQDQERDIADYLGVRPLVVIDPEDREQVELLLSLLKSQDRAPEMTDIMQAALREFASPTPSKPDEPMGLGAVVEDAEGEPWIRAAHPNDGMPRPWAQRGNVGSVAMWRRYADINVVRVLSEGVQP